MICVFQHIEKIVGKENMNTFTQKFKETITKEAKTDEIKKLDVEIRGSNNEPQGISLEINSFKKEEYSSMITEEKEYMKDSISIFTLGFQVKDENSAEIVNSVFEVFRPMIDNAPFLKNKKEAITYHLRTKETYVNLDVMFHDDKIQALLNEVGIDIGDFDKCNMAIKSGFAPPDLFNLNLAQLVEKIVQLLIKINGESRSFHYFSKAISAGLNAIETNDEKIKKNIKRTLLILNGFDNFSGAKFTFKYIPTNLYSTLIEKVLSLLGEGSSPEASFENTKTMILNIGKNSIKPTLEDLNILDTVKSLNVDEIKGAFANTKSKSGICFSLKLPGITQTFDDNFFK